MPSNQLLSDFQEMLRGISTGLVEQAQVERGSRWLEAFANEFPLAHLLLMNALYKTPADVMKVIGLLVPELKQYRKNEHVLIYIGKLQDELKGRRKP